MRLGGFFYPPQVCNHLQVHMPRYRASTSEMQLLRRTTTVRRNTGLTVAALAALAALQIFSLRRDKDRVDVQLLERYIAASPVLVARP